MSYQQEKFKEIANKIREKTGTTTLIVPNDFASKIDDVYEAGRATGGGETLPDADVMEFPLAEISIGRVSTDSEYYTEIANAISEYGDYRSCKPSEMRHGVYSVQKRQYESGFSDGQEEGYANGLTEGEATGRQAQYDEFWDTIQNSGARTNYSRAFANRNFNDELFNPKYDFVASSMYQCFEENDLLTDIRKKGDGTTLVIDGSSISDSTGFNRCFYGMSNIQYIGKIKSIAAAPWDRTFQSVTSLEEITLEGTIGTAFDIHWSTKLSRGSLLSILNACNKQEAGVTITLPAKCINGKTVTETYIASDSELATALENARKSGYTISFS